MLQVKHFLQATKMASKFRLRHPTLWHTFSPLPKRIERQINNKQTITKLNQDNHLYDVIYMYIQCLYICSKTLNQVKQVYKNRSMDSCIFNGYQCIVLLFQPTDSYIRVRPTWYRLTQQFIPECTDTYPQHEWKCPKNMTRINDY